MTTSEKSRRYFVHVGARAIYTSQSVALHSSVTYNVLMGDVTLKPHRLCHSQQRTDTGSCYLARGNEHLESKQLMLNYEHTYVGN